MEPWLGIKEKEAILKYLDSGGWLTEYKKTEEFEENFKSFTGSKYASAITNGTLSLVVALLCLDLHPNDEILVPDYTMIASVNSIKLAGGQPILVDIDPENLCLDLNMAEKKINERTKGIIYVSNNGRCHNMNKIIQFASQNDLFIIEDASQSLGCYNNNKHLGTFGTLGTFSLSPTKIITTGQGGMIITDNYEIYKKIEMIKDYGRPKSGIDYYEILGYNFKFTDLQAVIGLEQMKKLPWRLKRKKKMYKFYKDELENLKKVQLINTNLKETSPWFIDILVNKKDRNSLIEFMKKENIEIRPFYPAIHTQPPYKYIKGSFDNSLEISERGVWLPSSTFLKNEDIQLVCNKIKKFYENYR
jgi:perosamine synthetase